MNKKCTIEKISIDEYHKCSNIWDMEKFPHTEEFREQIINKKRIVYIYKIGNEFIGEGNIVFEKGEYTIPGKRIYLSHLIVKREYRNKGIGSEILKFIIKLYKQYGYSEITLGVDCKNSSAIHIYEKYGFKVYEAAEDEYGKFYKMIKNLGIEQEVNNAYTQRN